MSRDTIHMRLTLPSGALAAKWDGPTVPSVGDTVALSDRNGRALKATEIRDVTERRWLGPYAVEIILGGAYDQDPP